MIYGDTCSCIELKKNVAYATPQDVDSFQLIMSPVGAIVYSYLPGFYQAEEEPAIVIRSLDAITPEKTVEIVTNGGHLPHLALNANERNAAAQALDALELCKFLKIFEKHWSVFLGASLLESKGKFDYIVMMRQAMGGMPGFLPADWKALAHDAPVLADAQKFLKVENDSNPEIGKRFALEVRKMVQTGNSSLPLGSAVSLAKYLGILTPNSPIADHRQLGTTILEQFRERLSAELAAFQTERELVHRFYEILRSHSLLLALP